ncbi:MULTISPECIES: precorrin-3B synthase [unclassified Pseudomonas]|uniref:precorrin-3B synthase n=1 Tax=unclassified Pseudomonas TaxID=196821 RepID=UPI000485D646|nr:MULTISPECIES: precorrin-3B synthase [unclassified Pseudomonas]SCX35827.1 precorrin-3B synthase [Pseudomonas sp. NFACC25]SMF27826.1 precorrin-3B synthase [Pseudomonas sp. LAMO17WK12:I1]
MPPDKAGIIPRLYPSTGSPVNPTPAVNTLRPSACPGLLRIVQALDGGICRIKLAGGSISAAQACAVADAAQAYAGGVIEATNRANLQIRGIGAEQDALIAMLLAADLGPSNAAGDDVRNLMLSPSAGIDPQMLFDTRPLAEQILASLQNRPRFHELSAKFAVQLDGGEALAMLEHHHDLWLSAFVRNGETLLAFGLAGCPGQDAPLAAVPLAQGHGLVVAVLEAFLDLATPEQTRMRHLAVDKLLSRLSLPLLPADGFKRPPSGALLHLGSYPQAQSNQFYVAAIAPLGRLDSTMLTGVAQLASEYGDGTVRFTPWQGVLLPNVEKPHAVTQRLAQLGFLCTVDQPLARVIACTGSSGCAKALADTKPDAVHLAALHPGHDVHLSGCSRSCAAAHIAPVTLLAVSPGHYDLYFRDAAHPGFGRLHARTLSIEAAGALLRAHPRSNTDD